MDIKTGSILKIKGLDAHVIGWVRYKNTQDGNKTWVEYRLKTNKGERWLSVDDVYKEYSISWAANNVRGNIGPEWHEVDKGHQVVVACSGDVDVENGDAADFVEFEDAEEEKILSTEIWDDGTEYSMGEYLDLDEIKVVGYEEPSKSSSVGMVGAAICFVSVVLTFICAIAILVMPSGGNKLISDYLKKDQRFGYVTSITGNENQKADVYENLVTYATTDDTARDIIDGVEGNTESVTQKDDVKDGDIAIVTKKEYCLIYHPEDEPEKIYVQVSNRKYNYSSDNSPYRSSGTTTHWYRSHYYSSSYTKDSSSFSKTPSAYQSYSGDTIHNIGNGYFDSYSSSVRQSSINSRNSSGGGLGGGK
ncbi:DUF4178 domain-containing protein [Oribacterium sp. P6A1]|uniref:DUF4178 domain-containing protein n=1 Tax=Oribacterium sp. P6A1 TaxID=1410612 RepID=UPI00055D1569|nr:DUF4178 domain-containing protein [Oribacterium sp. P6A1]